jgi:magnesium and cobalt transporter
MIDFFKTLFTPIVSLFDKLIGYFFGNKYSQDQAISSIKNMLHNTTSIDNDTKFIIDNGLDFIHKDVESVMVPRANIFAVESCASIDQINQVVLSTTYTRIVVYSGDLDNVIGFIHIKDLYKNLVLGKTFVMADILRIPITVVPSIRLVHLLELMQKARTHLALVVDEYGCTVGIVTNENVIEALVGNIDDEHEATKSQDEYQLINQETLICSAKIKISKVEELLNINLHNQEHDCETLGGIIIAIAGKVPEVGNIFSINDNVQVEVLEATSRVLKKLKIQLIHTTSI